MEEVVVSVWASGWNMEQRFEADVLDRYIDEIVSGIAETQA